MRIIAIIKPKFKFIKVTVKMFHADLMIRSDHRTLEQAPGAFNGIGVNVTPHPFIGAMVDRRMADAMAQIPSRAVSNLQSPSQLVCADAFLCVNNQIYSQKPLPERQMGIVHNGFRGHTELIPASIAIILVSFLDFCYFFAITM